jgi:hypothetical protein
MDEVSVFLIQPMRLSTADKQSFLDIRVHRNSPLKLGHHEARQHALTPDALTFSSSGPPLSVLADHRPYKRILQLQPRYTKKSGHKRITGAGPYSKSTRRPGKCAECTRTSTSATASGSLAAAASSRSNPLHESEALYNAYSANR